MLDVELGLAAIFGTRIGVSPGELLDFILGWTGIDVGADDNVEPFVVGGDQKFCGVTTNFEGRGAIETKPRLFRFRQWNMPNGKTGLTLRFLGQGNPSIVILLPDLPPGFSEFDTEDDRVAVWFLADHSDERDDYGFVNYDERIEDFLLTTAEQRRAYPAAFFMSGTVTTTREYEQCLEFEIDLRTQGPFPLRDVLDAGDASPALGKPAVVRGEFVERWISTKDLGSDSASRSFRLEHSDCANCGE